MLGKMGKAAEDIECVVIAGAFGNYIDKASAVRIGVLPDVGMDRIISAGNTAGAGVSMALASAKEMKLAENVVSEIKHVDLAAMEEFQNTYLAAMAFRQI